MGFNPGPDGIDWWNGVGAMPIWRALTHCRLCADEAEAREAVRNGEAWVFGELKTDPDEITYLDWTGDEDIERRRPIASP